jgi:cytochrome c peroxidase
VAKNPRKPYTGIVTEGDKHFFKAIFADRAVSVTCVACHNSHELSSKRDYKLYDVMGGIIISFPVQ